MSFNRYLLHFSYIGTRFLGAQRQVTGTLPRKDDPTTIQGQLEMGLKILNPCNEPIVYLSSRTDSGVHALNATCHVDLFRRNGLRYEPQSITVCLNKHFQKQEIPIRILKTLSVPDNFNCRHEAISRTYLYRLGVFKTDAKLGESLGLIPFEELERSYFVCGDKFDIDKMRKAAKIFEGLHDFRTFMGKETKEPHKMTRRFIDNFEITEELPRTYSSFSWPTVSGVNEADYQFIHFYIKANGFLYRQVRRMVASLIALAQGKISISDLKSMLEVPSHRSWNDRIKTAPAHGLYLCQVEYSERFFQQH